MGKEAKILRKSTMDQNFSLQEKKLIGGISLLLAIRMLGTSMVYPVFSIFATGIAGSTEALAGLAVGIFGFFQTILQIPMGRLSDRWGRKETALLGLGIFIAGTVLSGMATNIYLLIAARALAGAGAVSGVTLAWLTDGIEAGQRNTAFSYVGMSIGLSVIVGVSISSVVAGHFGFPVLFYLCAALTAVAMVITWRYLHNGKKGHGGDEQPPLGELLAVLRNRDLMRLYLTGFVSNFALAGIFFTLPILINKQIQLGAMWKVYAPMAIIGTWFMYYYGKRADQEGTRKIALIGLSIEAAGVVLPLINQDIPFLFGAFILFYAGHCILQPVLPAAVSRCPTGGQKGAVMSAFNSSQFIGSALGGISAGIFYGINEILIFPLLGFLILLSLVGLSRFRNYGFAASSRYDK